MSDSWTPGTPSAVTVFTEDLAASREFYRRAFALDVVFEDADSVVFRLGDTLLNVLAVRAATGLVAPVPAAPPEAGVRMQFTLGVEDVDATVAQLRERGVELLRGPEDRPWGIRTATFRDPSGHVWEIAPRPVPRHDPKSAHVADPVQTRPTPVELLDMPPWTCGTSRAGHSRPPDREVPMYVPAHFAMDDAAMRELLARHGAADLVTATADGLVATMLPFVHDPTLGEHGALLGHVARNNDQWRRPVVGDALAIVRGPDAYVSPGWYASKAEHGRVVPTWNYVTAHVYGRLVVHDDPAWVDDVVRRLTAKHEASSAHPWSVDDAPPAFVAGQLRAIVGVELRITRIEAKAKLSQNRSAADVDGVVAGLAARGDAVSAAAVRAVKQKAG